MKFRLNVFFVKNREMYCKIIFLKWQLYEKFKFYFSFFLHILGIHPK